MNKGFNRQPSGSVYISKQTGGTSGSAGSGLPQGYLQGGYFDAKGNLVDKFIIDWAKDIADRLYQGKMKTTQLRKFFGEARRLDTKLELADDFDSIKSEILKLSPYAHEAVKKQKAPPVFEEFMSKNIKVASQNKKNFTEGFLNHFECIIAYFPETRV